MRVLIIGGTGHFSGRITESALAHGHEVVLYNRGQRPLPNGLDLPIIRGERAALREHATEIAAFRPEAVIDSICYLPPQAEDLVALFPDVRRVAFISSVDAYGQDLGAMPVTETREPAPVSDYGKGKLACEHTLFAGLGKTAAAFRPSHILGRGFLTTSLWSRNACLVDRLLKGKHVPAIDGGRNLMTPVHARDAAEWVVRSLDNAAADGQAFNVVGGQIITQKRYYECVAEALGVELKLVAVPSPVFMRHFESPPQFNWHRPFSCAKAAALMGYPAQFTPEMMLRETVRHMVDHGLVGDSDLDPFDDQLVALLLRHEAELDALFEQKK